MANTVINNQVIENTYNSVLTSKLDLMRYATVDYSLAQTAGTKKTVYQRSVKGDLEEVAMGAGNTKDIEVTVTPTEYEVGTTQGRFTYFDEEIEQDANVIDTGVTGMAEKFMNDMNSKIVTELGKATLTSTYTAVSFDTFVDALAKLNHEDESQFFCLINPTMLGAVRKALKDDLKYNTDIVTTGYVGSVVGMPLIVSKAVTNDTILIASNKAVKVFVKKDSEVEQDRDKNLRKNMIYTRKVAVVALYDTTECVKITKQA